MDRILNSTTDPNLQKEDYAKQLQARRKLSPIKKRNSKVLKIKLAFLESTVKEMEGAPASVVWKGTADVKID